MRLALIGTGRMGTPIAARLRAAGHQLVVYDASPEARQRLAAAGHPVATDAAAAALNADAVVLSLPDAAAVSSVFRELPADSFVIDLTSSLPRLTRQLGRRMVDAPVSGGVAGAEAGTLTAMVGGDAGDLAAARPVLEAFAARIFHAGPLGSGHAAKALNNALSAVALSATSEAVAIGRYAGHRPEGVVKRLNAGLGRTQNSEVKFPRDILTGAYASGFTAGLMLKDVGIATTLAAERGVPAPLIGLAGQLWNLVPADQDFTRVHEVVSGWGDPGFGRVRCDLDHFDLAVAATCLLAAREAVAVAEAEGLARGRFLEIVNAGSGRSEATRHFETGLGFTPRQAVRALDAVRGVAAAGRHPVPELALAAELWGPPEGGVAPC